MNKKSNRKNINNVSKIRPNVVLENGEPLEPKVTTISSGEDDPMQYIDSSLKNYLDAVAPIIEYTDHMSHKSEADAIAHAAMLRTVKNVEAFAASITSASDPHDEAEHVKKASGREPDLELPNGIKVSPDAVEFLINIVNHTEEGTGMKTPNPLTLEEINKELQAACAATVKRAMAPDQPFLSKVAFTLCVLRLRYL